MSGVSDRSSLPVAALLLAGGLAALLGGAALGARPGVGFPGRLLFGLAGLAGYVCLSGRALDRRWRPDRRWRHDFPDRDGWGRRDQTGPDDRTGHGRPAGGPPARLLRAALAGFTAFAPLAVAQETPKSDAPAAAPAPRWYEAISVNGFVSTSWSYSFNRPASGTNRYRVFDFDDDSLKVDVAELVLQKAVSKAGDVGFRVDAVAGGSIPRVSAASGLFRDPATGAAEDFDLQQAFVSWVAPVGRGLRLDIGKMVTTAGYEVVEGYDGYDDNATRSFLFGYAQPTTHTGLRATYAFSDMVSANVMLVNGWDDVKDRNSGKTVGAGLTLSPTPKLSLTANYLCGPERTDDDADARSLLDFVAVLKPGDALTLGLNVDRGTEEGLTAGGGSATWWGVAGYLRVGLTSSFAVTLRAEYFDDADGVRTGTAQELKELTLTPELKLGGGLLARADLRVDFSDASVFEDPDGASTKKEQATILLNVAYVF